MWRTFTKRWERCAYKKKHDNVPGKAYYRYDDSFKNRVVSDLSQGLISERKAAILHNVNRKTLAKWRQEFIVVEGEQPAPVKTKKPKVDAALVLSIFSLEQANKALTEALAHEKMRAEALQTIIEVGEMDLGISLKKKPSSL